MRPMRTALAVAVCVLATATSCGPGRPAAGAEGCAIMADAIGLYPGNPVTALGYPIGTVRAVTPAAEHVRVDFTVEADRRIPADGRAVTRSTSILADRSLELVGNHTGGPELDPARCIPPDRTATPKSLSELVGSIATFADALSPPGSTGLADTVDGLYTGLHGQGPRTADLLTRMSALLQSPDRAISDTGAVLANRAQLSGELTALRGTAKQVLLDAEATTGDLVAATDGVRRMTETLPLMVTMVADLERELGDETQRVLDTVSIPLRKASPHATALAGLLNPIPGWISNAADRFNDQGLQLKWRPPMFRIRTPDGLLQCGIMNSRVPGSCADIAGTPYAVDVALLQYALIEAAR